VITLCFPHHHFHSNFSPLFNPRQTGLCVYEIDDPSIRSVHFPRVFPNPLLTCTRHSRDDPNVDESTRYRNRIAELESLVRELRGKSSSLTLFPIHPHG
jgi:hypothetical protein